MRYARKHTATMSRVTELLISIWSERFCWERANCVGSVVKIRIGECNKRGQNTDIGEY